MNCKPKPQALLRQIARISWMERGKLCPLRAGAYFNHQTWQQGRNVVRYVPRDQVAHLRKAIAGYQQYRKLTTAYAEAIIRRTRQSHCAPASRPARQKRGNSPKSRGNRKI